MEKEGKTEIERKYVCMRICVYECMIKKKEREN